MELNKGTLQRSYVTPVNGETGVEDSAQDAVAAPRIAQNQGLTTTNDSMVRIQSESQTTAKVNGVLIETRRQKNGEKAHQRPT